MEDVEPPVERLLDWMSVLNAPIEMIDGLLFVDKERVGVDALRALIGEFRDAGEAQGWMNMVPLSDLFFDVFPDLNEVNDDQSGRLLRIVRDCWEHQVRAKFGLLAVKIEEWVDDDGDFGVSLRQ